MRERKTNAQDSAFVLFCFLFSYPGTKREISLTFSGHFRNLNKKDIFEKKKDDVQVSVAFRKRFQE